MTPISDLLDASMNPTSPVFNQLDPQELTTSRALTNILDLGILSRKALIERNLALTGGYDVDPSSVVFLNVITHEQGVSRAALSSADGIFAVGMEREGDETIINNYIHIEQLEHKFQEILSNITQGVGSTVDPTMYPLFREKAKFELLGQNRDFLDVLENRIQNTAVFILDIEPTGGDKLDDPSGSHDAVRPSISPKNIQTILISKEFSDSAEIVNIHENRIKAIVPVEEKTQIVPYTFRTGTGVKVIRVTLNAPDYQTALNRIFKEQFEPSGKPMFIHAARI